nr:MAG TPA: hypothetical protein [Caudoviricetes sp.]DAV19939.1 MAG TPA: hypothetical protein [Caudoviricetes sp.]
MIAVFLTLVSPTQMVTLLSLQMMIEFIAKG